MDNNTLIRDIAQDYQHEADALTQGDYFLEGFTLGDTFAPLQKQNKSTNSALLSSKGFLENAPEFIRIALSGGPSSGKSTLINTWNEGFENVFVYKEVSSQLIQYILQRLQKTGPEKINTRASELFSNKNHTQVYEHLVLLIKELQKKYADHIGQGVHISDRAGIEGYHFMHLGGVSIGPETHKRLQNIKEKIVFFCDRRKIVEQNGIRYENNNDAQKQHEALQSVLLEQGYILGKDLHVLPTFLPHDVFVSNEDYQKANQTRAETIAKILLDYK